MMKKIILIPLFLIVFIGLIYSAPFDDRPDAVDAFPGGTLSEALCMAGNYLQLDTSCTDVILYSDSSTDFHVSLGGSKRLSVSLAGDITLYGSKKITTTNNQDLTLDAHGTGDLISQDLTQICDSACPSWAYVSGAGDLGVEGRLEVKGTLASAIPSLLISSQMQVPIGASYLIGAIGTSGNLVMSQYQTPDSIWLGVGSASNVLILGERPDWGVDLAITQKTNPTLAIVSADVTGTPRYAMLYHDGTSASAGAFNVTTISGDIDLGPASGVVNVVSNLVTPKFKIDASGCQATLLKNSYGTLTQGALLQADANTDASFTIAAASAINPIGALLDTSCTLAADCWVCIGGRVQLLLKDATACTANNWCGTSDVAGRADCTAGSPASQIIHFQEVAHSIQTIGSGTDVLCETIMHFN